MHTKMLSIPIRCMLVICVLVGALTRPSLSAAPRPGWILVWNDEFDGTKIDRNHWDFDIGNGFFAYDANMWINGWGNDELQYYTAEPANAFVKEGILHIRALKESTNGFGYTSARMKTRRQDGVELFAKKYGRFEFRAKLPTGQGVWPALWLLPQDTAYGTWAASGEIDVMEARGQEPGIVLGTLHYGSRWPNNTNTSVRYDLPAGDTIANFHIYAVEWESDQFRWYVDDTLISTQSFWWSCSHVTNAHGMKPSQESDINPWPAPFDRPFFILMNLAVGGKFLGNPDDKTPFPAEMLIDYVRVYDKVDGYHPPRPERGEGEIVFEPAPQINGAATP